MQTISENLMMERLKAKPDLFYPLKIELTARDVAMDEHTKNLQADGILKISYADKTWEMIIESKTRTALSIVEKGLDFLSKVKDYKNYGSSIPTLYVPYLSERIVEKLKEKSISGIDMNGNYYIISTELIAIRLDRKNEFKEQTTIKDIYSRNSSIVARLLLKEKQVINSLSFILNKLIEKGFELSPGTVSKVLKSLEEDLMITRNEDIIKVLQPEMLLNKLLRDYKKPKVIGKRSLRLPEDKSAAVEILNNILGNNKWIWTGESSAVKYASTTPSNKFYIYSLSNYYDEMIESYVDNKFYNYEVNYIKDKYVFFDSSDNYASRLQTYIELSNLDKREKEIAEDIKRSLLNGLE